MTLILLALLGLAVGAVLNTLADDLPHRARPRSPHCAACDQPHAPLQWIAIASFIVGRGRCAHCGAPLPLRRLIVEIASALLLVFLFQKFGATIKFGLLAALLEGLLLITVIDLEHRLILYVTIFPMIGIAVLYSLFGAERDPVRILIGGVVGFGVFFLFYVLSWGFEAVVNRMRGEPLKEVSFGGGDVNLAGVAGLAVGWSGVVFMILITVFSGGIVAGIYLLLMRLRRDYQPFTPIPYGPFIVLGTFILLVFDAEIRQYFAR